MLRARKSDVATPTEHPTRVSAFALSVVLPVYYGVDAAHLRRALESVYAQTLLPQEVVVVEDGELTAPQLAVLDDFAHRLPAMHRVILPVNRGAGQANDAGLRAASAPWIAKMDADDVALPTRFERQVRCLESGGYDLVGCAMYEFAGTEENILGIRRMPESHAAIARYVRTNNPVNHPTIVFRRALALRVGGYQSIPYLEDYDLVARLLASGATMHNMSEPLMLFRAGSLMLNRRRSRQLFLSELTLQRNLHKYGLTGRFRAVVNFVARSGFRMLPAPMMATAYRRLFYSRRRLGDSRVDHSG